MSQLQVTLYAITCLNAIIAKDHFGHLFKINKETTCTKMRTSLAYKN